MKKILAMLLAVTMLLSLAACGGNNTSSTAQSSAAESSAAESSEAEQSAEAEPVDTGDDAPDAASLLSAAFIDPLADWSQYDEMIAQIKAETDMAARAELMHQAEDVLMANGCIIPIYYYNDIFLMKDYVEGFYNAPLGTKYFFYTSRTDGGTTLRINLSSEPDYLDPTLNSSADGSILAANSFSGLYNYDENGDLAPACAAEMFEVSDDGLHYTVKLKEGLKWSDGSDLNANDFVYSWKRAASEETAADYAYMFDVFQGYPNDLAVVATDDYTLEFDLNAPCAYMGDLMAFTTYLPVKQSEVEGYADYQTSPGGWAQEAGFISNGAYVCTEWKHNESMVYEKNPNWYDADKVQIDRIELMLSADDTAIFAAYNAGDLDFADTVPTDEVASLLDDPEFHIIDQLGTYYCAFNAKSPIFDGKTPEQAAAMRLAFSILIDRDYICENIGQTGQLAANAYIPIGMADGNGGIFKSGIEDGGYYDPYGINNDYEGTVEQARTYLKAAGFKFDDDGTLSDETPISIEYLTNESSGHIAIAEAIQQDLSVVGIEISIQTQDWNVFLEERKNGNYDFAREGWIADFNDPINMLEMFTTDSGNNDPQFGR